MKTIKQTYHINSPLEEVWKALTDPKYIEEWGGGPTKMNDKVGTKFEFWGGDIHGTNTEVITNQKLVQDWYGGNWPQPSKVTFILKELTDGETRIDLIHENLPDNEADDFADGWKRYYLGEIKKFLEG